MLYEYLIGAFLISLGTLIGTILSKISPEELKDAKPYLIKLEDTIFIILILTLTYYNLTNILILILAALLLTYWFKESITKHYYIIEFIIMGILLGIGYVKELFILIGSLTFIYTATSNLMLASKFKGKNYKTQLKFTILRIFFFLIGSLITYGVYYLIMF